MMESDSRSRERTFRNIVLLLGLFFVAVQVNRSAGGVLANYLTETSGFDPADIGAVMGAMFLASAIGQLPTGLLFDRFGPKTTLVTTSILASAGIAIFAWSSSPEGMFIGRFIIGLGHGGVISAMFLIAASWASPDRVGQSTAAIVGIGGGIGGVIATTPLALVLERYGQEAAFSLLAGLTFLLTIAIYLLVRETPETDRPAEPKQHESFLQSLKTLVEVIRMPEARGIYVMGVCFTAPFMTIGGLWAGPYFNQIKALSAEETSLVLLVLVLALHIGTYAYGVLDRIFAHTKKQVVVIGVVIQVGCLTPVILWPEMPILVSVPLLFVFACAAPLFVILISHLRAFIPAERVGRAITVVSLFGLTGASILQFATGAVMDWAVHGLDKPVLGFQLSFATVALALLVTVARYLRQPERPPAPYTTPDT